MRALVLTLLGATALSVAGCAPRYRGGARALTPDSLGAGWRRALPPAVFRQRSRYDCGATALAIVLGHWKKRVDLDDIVRATHRRGRPGIRAGALREYARARGLRAYLVRGTLRDLAHELARGRPVIVGTVKSYGREAVQHYQVVVGIRHDATQIATFDPADGWRRYTKRDFVSEWKRAHRLALVVLPPAGGVGQSVTLGQKCSRAVARRVNVTRLELARSLHLDGAWQPSN